MRSYSLDEAYLNVTQALVNRLQESAAAPAPAPTVAVEGPPGTKQDGSGRSVQRVGFGRPAAASAASGGKDLSARVDTSLRRRGEGSSVTGPATAAGEEDEEGEDGEGGREGYGGEGERPGRNSREEHRVRAFEAARCLAEEIRGRIKKATKLTASVGIGPNFMLAKVGLCARPSARGCAFKTPKTCRSYIGYSALGVFFCRSRGGHGFQALLGADWLRGSREGRSERLHATTSPVFSTAKSTPL